MFIDKYNTNILKYADSGNKMKPTRLMLRSKPA